METVLTLRGFECGAVLTWKHAPWAMPVLTLAAVLSTCSVVMKCILFGAIPSWACLGMVARTFFVGYIELRVAAARGIALVAP